MPAESIHMKIIINCDDLGASLNVNNRIFELMEQRRVTSATLMMNGPAVEEAVQRIGKFRECSFGVHLNLTEFSPLTGQTGLVALLDENGKFNGTARRSPRDIPLSASIRARVYAEWAAQIERALALGVPISHFDSHHHVHTRMSLLPVLRRLRQSFGIRKVRLRHNISGVTHSMSPQRYARNSAWNFNLRHYAGATTTHGFASFSVFHERLQAGLGFPRTIEVMCHPGGELFAAETELLRGAWQQKLGAETQLISYNELT
jgi:predicted glycoside hydrolase/deacetylase ChbG (UPF0249 family)